MIDKLGISGIAGVVLMLAGVALIASVKLVIAGGIALVIAGMGLMVYGLVTGFLDAMGMGGMI